MRKTAIAIAVALTGFAAVAQTAPKDHTWYVGSKLGWAQFHDTAWNTSVLDNDGPTHVNQLGAGAFAAYQINPYLGFEMGYDWLGRIPYKGDTTNGSFKARGVQLNAKLSYPATNELDVYTRLGGMVWHADFKHSLAGKDHDTDISPVFGGGIEWTITPDIATRFEYQWVNNIGNNNVIGVCPDNGMLSLGIAYRFGQREETSAMNFSSAPAPEVQTKKFTLKSDVLFNFNKATLKSEGQAILDQMYRQLSNLDSKDDSVLVLGFSDRIGSNTYNQTLSEQRTQSVVDYLIFKGIPSSKIFARGMGSSNSITGNACNNVKIRSALIDCLAPDRRVQVEITGTKDVVTHPSA